MNGIAPQTALGASAHAPIAANAVPLNVAHSAACDVLVVGAGPAGLSAARAAASRGAQVVVLDDNPASGGQIWRGGPGVESPAVARALLREVAAQRNIRIHHGAKVVGVLAEHRLLVETDSGAIRMQWGRLIVCTGARERLLPFPGWTLPGVTGVGGLQALIKGGMPVRGERLVIAGSGPLLLAAAATARKAGAELLRVAEHASLQNVARFAVQLPRWPSKLVQALQLRDAAYRASSTLLSVGGKDRVESVTLLQGTRSVTLACERVACGYGLLPNTTLAEALGCSLRQAQGISAISVDAQQATSVKAIYAAGECTGTGGSESAMAQGSMAGFAAIGELQMVARYEKERARWSAFAALASGCFALDDSLQALPQPDTLVCRCEDVSHAAMQAHSNWTEAKIHTRCGMGACQGKVCASAAQFLYGWDLPQARMPFSSARIGTLAAAVETGTEAAA
jgi:NADPH-dependent 2,4-dienoyl-CoA reductase/sulfur reductase-like enzyme